MTWVILGHVYAFGLSSGGGSSSFNSSYEFINPYKLSILFYETKANSADRDQTSQNALYDAADWGV